MQVLNILSQNNTNFRWDEGKTCLKLASKLYDRDIDPKEYGDMSEARAVVKSRQEFGSVGNAYAQAFINADIEVEDYTGQEIRPGDITIVTGHLKMEGLEHDCYKKGEALGFYAENGLYYTVTPYGLKPMQGYSILKVVRHP